MRYLICLIIAFSYIEAMETTNTKPEPHTPPNNYLKSVTSTSYTAIPILSLSYEKLHQQETYPSQSLEAFSSGEEKDLLQSPLSPRSYTSDNENDDNQNELKISIASYKYPSYALCTLLTELEQRGELTFKTDTHRQETLKTILKESLSVYGSRSNPNLTFSDDSEKTDEQKKERYKQKLVEYIKKTAAFYSPLENLLANHRNTNNQEAWGPNPIYNITQGGQLHQPTTSSQHSSQRALTPEPTKYGTTPTPPSPMRSQSPAPYLKKCYQHQGYLHDN